MAGKMTMSGGLKAAMGYSALSAGEDVGNMLTANTSGLGASMSVGDSTNPAGDFHEHRSFSWPDIQSPPSIPAGPGPDPLPIGSIITQLESADFESVIRKISLALEHLDEEELAEQLKAAKQINILANQILAITFQSGLGDVEVSQALVAEAQALKTRALTILRAILDFVAENYEDEEGEDVEE